MKPDLSVVGLLAGALVCSAIGLVYVNHARRTAFIELQALERARDALQIEWGQLELEQSSWGAGDRIEKLARERLGLSAPAPDAIVLVTP